MYNTVYKSVLYTRSTRQVEYPFSYAIDYSAFSVTLTRDTVDHDLGGEITALRIEKALARISPDDRARMRTRLVELMPSLQYAYPFAVSLTGRVKGSPDALDRIAQRLSAWRDEDARRRGQR